MNLQNLGIFVFLILTSNPQFYLFILTSREEFMTFFTKIQCSNILSMTSYNCESFEFIISKFPNFNILITSTNHDISCFVERNRETQFFLFLSMYNLDIHIWCFFIIHLSRELLLILLDLLKHNII